MQIKKLSKLGLFDDQKIMQWDKSEKKIKWGFAWKQETQNALLIWLNQCASLGTWVLMVFH